MSEQLHDQFKDVPSRNVSPIAMQHPNDSIDQFTQDTDHRISVPRIPAETVPLGEQNQVPLALGLLISANSLLQAGLSKDLVE